ncbi:glycosyltransferase [Akkermansiaceae bacterium]|nr:glycosyltransferase [Akkermansiaceae bacterium]
MEGYIPQSERKKILLLCDDIRTHSGIGTIAKEIVLHTCHHYNWVQVAAAIKHPEHGKKMDLSEETNKIAGLSDSSVTLYPNDGYGNPDLIRHLLKEEKPDAIFIFTDPRYWTWLFQIENEIRKNIPIIYLNIWDDYPAPMYNKTFYESCDLLMGISKQTVNINKLVLGDKAEGKIIEYVPHGLNHKLYYPIQKDHKEWDEYWEFQNKLFQGEQYDFVALYNSRNIRRKQVPDTIWAFKQFVDKLPLEQAKKCALVLHTAKVDNNGTNLPAVIEALCGKEEERYNFIFSDQKLSVEQMNYLYNSTDVQIQLTSNEGWGLSLTEALLVGNPIIANVTGGMQDQMRFVDNNEEWFTPSADIPSNHRGTYRNHGKWALPVYPSNISIVGSVPTPYIFDDRCDASDAADRLREAYEMGPKERKMRGKLGREWALSDEAGFTSEKMGYRVMSNINNLLETWKPRKKYNLIKVTKPERQFVPHNLNY